MVQAQRRTQPPRFKSLCGNGEGNIKITDTETYAGYKVVSGGYEVVYGGYEVVDGGYEIAYGEK